MKRILTLSVLALAMGLGIAAGNRAEAWWGWGPWGGGPWNGAGAGDVTMGMRGGGHGTHHPGYWYRPYGYAPWAYGPYDGGRWGGHPWGWGAHPRIPHAYGAPYGYVPPQPVPDGTLGRTENPAGAPSETRDKP